MNRLLRWGSVVLACYALGACSSGLSEDGVDLTNIDIPPIDLTQEAVNCEADADCADFLHGGCELALCHEDGFCITLAMPNGSLCDDGNVCTEDDRCAAGACEGGSNDCTCVEDADCAAFQGEDLCAERLICETDVCVPDPAGPVVCQGDSACAPAACNPSTGSCEAETLPDGSPCEGGDACLTGTTCTDGACGGGSPVTCPDEGPCAEVACDAEVGCVATLRDDGTECTDGDPCTLPDVCNQGVCVGETNVCDCQGDEDCAPFVVNACEGGLKCSDSQCVPSDDPPVACPPSDSPCLDSACDPDTGVCGILPVADGTVCGAEGTCAQGSCQVGTCEVPEDACDDDNPCTEDMCDSVKGCSNTPVAGDCDDGNGCTTDDTCVDGQCVGLDGGCVCAEDGDCVGVGYDACLGEWVCENGACAVIPDTAVDCSALEALEGGPCLEAICDGVTGDCELVALEEGSACDDGQPCTVDTVCAGGDCEGTANACDDDNACTNDACTPGLGCKNTFNSLPCDDGNACTKSDICIQGGCYGGAAVQCDTDSPCLAATCDTEVGCVESAANDGAACDDGTVCTQDEACTNGVCKGTSQCECLSDDECEDDGDLCNGVTKCTAEGVCLVDPDTVVTCATDTPCQVAVCDHNTGTCGTVPDESGTSCDAGPCFLPGQCQGGACQATSVDCDDGNPCTADGCNEQSGTCVSEPGASLACDDGDPCTVSDFCDGDTCSAGAQFVCDDGNPCTKDECLSGQGCAFDAIDCDDSNPCTDDTCEAGVGCAHTPKACGTPGVLACVTGVCDQTSGECVDGVADDGTVCDDGNPCTASDACVGGVCVSTTPTDCDDNNPCTLDLCQFNGCDNPLFEGPCDDGNACTSGDKCTAQGCTGEVVSCDDGDPCTSDSCGAGGDCVNAPIEGCGIETCKGEGTQCDDEDPDTSGDMCLAGVCRGFTAEFLWASPGEGNVALTRIDHALDRWFMGVHIYGGQVGEVFELITYDADGDELGVYEETANSNPWSAIRGGYAVHEGSELWRFEPSVGEVGAWSGDNSIGGAFEDSELEQPIAMWTSPAGDGLWPGVVWIAGGEDEGGKIRRCTESAIGGLLGADCDEQDLPSQYQGDIIRAIAGTAQCLLGNTCTYHLALAADYKTGSEYFNDTFANNSGLLPIWSSEFIDPGASANQSRDMAALGDKRYVVAGLNGYMRYRASNGTWTHISSMKEGQSARAFRGVWSGAGVAVAAGTINATTGNSFELWTLSTASNTPTTGSAWTIVKLGTFTGDAILHDVWGTDDGTIRAVGTAHSAGAMAGVVFTRLP